MITGKPKRGQQRALKFTADALRRALIALEAGQLDKAQDLVIKASTGVNRCRRIAGASNIPPPKLQEPVAEVIEWLGYPFLKVAGVTMARLGDVCRDCTTPVSYWDERGLEEARDRINNLCRRKNPTA